MCGLFGFSRYGNEKFAGLSDLTNSLAEQSAVRGTDATGIAFNGTNHLRILKDGKSAHRMALQQPDEISALIGHTRHSTQGSEKRNYNNHPFAGKTRNAMFALAHNGVLINDNELRRELKLPNTKVETDSYIAVQLIESQRTLNMDSIKYMAEKVVGSFSFSVLDDKDNIYLVKGDSPLCILHFPKEKMYVFASTEEILFKAVIDSKLLSSLKKGAFEEIDISDGEILKICHDGKLIRDKFEYSIYKGRNWWDFGFSGFGYSKSEYIDDLKTIGAYYGYTPEDIDRFLKCGFSPEEIENFIYEY